MDKAKIREYCTAVFSFADSQSTDTVTYKIYRASDCSIFAQGNCSYVNGINWKVVFRPKTVDIFIVQAKNETLDVEDVRIFKVIEEKRG